MSSLPIIPGTQTTTTTTVLQTTSSLQQQVGVQLNNSIYNNQYNLGEFVTNVSLLPFLPSRAINFSASGMKPNTRLYAYFGSVPVSAWCTSVPSTSSNNPIQYKLGDPIVTNSLGQCRGIFLIPPETFRSEEIVFRLTDISSLEQGEDAVTTDARQVFYGSRLSVARGQSILSTRETVLSFEEVTQQRTVEGLAVNTSVVTTFVPDAPPVTNYGGGGGCGCGCFTYDTLVTMADGTTKEIKYIEVGDKVYNKDKTSINTVLFVEKISDTFFDKLYSPSEKFEPFATSNHPLYIENKLHSVEPEKTNNWYPWLGKAEVIKTEKIANPVGRNVYNLWLDGDGTYIVNGYGTTSIIGDGGVLLSAINDNIITSAQATHLMMKYTTKNRYVAYGAYITSNLLKKINSKKLNKFLINKVLENNSEAKFLDRVFDFIGKTAYYKNKLSRI